MGKIFVKGIGNVAIEGDTPNEVETQAILDAIGKMEAKDVGASEIAERETRRLPEMGFRGDQSANLANFRSRPTEGPAAAQRLGGRFHSDSPGLPPQGAGGVGRGPLGIVSPESRAATRRKVQGGPGAAPFLTEMAPSAGGAAIGGTVGSLLGPLGTMGGAAVGGLAGEALAQETGVAPTSHLNLGLAAGGPLVGGVAGKAFQGARRLGGLAATKAPFARAAVSQNAMSHAVNEFESLGTRIVGKQTGLMARSTDNLFSAVRKAKVPISPDQLSKSQAAITELGNQLAPLKAFPEVKAAIKTLDTIQKTLLGPDATLADILAARSLIGGVVKKAQNAGGVKLGSSKKVLSQLIDDMEAIASSPGLTGRQGKLAKAAVARAKLDFSIKSVERGVARFIKDTPELSGASFNVKGFQKWFRDVTNPKHARYDKNLTSALKDEIPGIKSRLAELAKISNAGGPGGPGSLVVRQRTAKVGSAVLGGALGFVGFGGTGAAVGAVIGAQVPEMVLAALMTKTGAAFLTSAMKAGQGKINARTWAVLGEIITRSAGDRVEHGTRPGRGGPGVQLPQGVPIDG